jgi:hypothetical protein
MRPNFPTKHLRHPFPPRSNRVVAGMLLAVLIPGLVKAREKDVPRVPPRPRYQQTAAESIPAPLPATTRPKDPLAVLLGDETNQAGYQGTGQLSVDIRPRDVREGKPLGDMPPNLAASVLPARPQTAARNCRRDWPLTCFHWEASALCHQPLYFEETNLERYGYSPHGLRLFQPLLSAGNFFLTAPLLPYKMGAQPPHQTIYTLGEYRPGSPVPYRIRHPQLSLLGIVAEAMVIGGLTLLIP